jgi:hypothetical protein
MGGIQQGWSFALIALPIVLANLSWADEPSSDAEKTVVELYNSEKLFDKREYKAVRAAFARREQDHQAEIQNAFGPEQEALTAWLKERPDIRENLYTAFDEKFDKIEPGLRLFKELWKQFPDQVDKYGNLAIAMAVTWDDPRGVYNYRGHQLRAKSTLPTSAAEATDNFKYLIDNDKTFQGRIQLLPWEFLVLLVDHRTGHVG